MKPKKVFILSGPPASGKSTWVKNQLKENPGIWCSRDAVRFSMLAEDEDYFAHEDEVYEKWINQIQQEIDNENSAHDIYIDATHLSRKSRKKTLKSLKLHDNVELYAVNFLTSLNTCLQRNAQREGRARVPDSVLKNMWLSFEPATEPIFKEHLFIREE